MNEPDDKLERELDALREMHAKLPRQEPGAAIDASILHAANRGASKPSRPWMAAAGLAACVGLAVMLVPVLMIEQPQQARPLRNVKVTLAEHEVAEEDAQADLAAQLAVRRAQRESAARQERVAPPVAAVEAKSALPETLAAAPSAELAAPSGLERVTVTGSRISRSDVEAAEIVERLEAEDAARWRARILATRAAGHEMVALKLLEAFRERFDRPEGFSLDDLAAEEAGARDE